MNLRYICMTMKNLFTIKLINTKSVILCCSLAFYFSLFSCKKIEQLLSFTITNETDFTVNSSSPVNLPASINTPDVATNSSQEFSNNNTKANLVKEIKLQSLKLNITDPTGQNFDFLKSVKIFISTNGSDEIELAALDNIPASTSVVDLIPTQSILDAYVKAPKYNLRTQVITNRILTQNVNIRSVCKFKVTANL